MDSVNIYPVLVTWKKSKKTGLCPIHISVDLNNKRCTLITTKRKILPEQWDSDKKKIKDNVTNAALINATIKKKVDRIDAGILRQQLMGAPVNKKFILSLVKNENSNFDFYEFCEQQIKLNYPNPDTQASYMAEISKLKKHAATLTFADIDFSFLQGYEAYMRDDLGNVSNTIWKSFKFMNRMLNLALKIGGYIVENIFEQYDRGSYEQGIPPYLEWHEVEMLHQTVKSSKEITEEARLAGYYNLLSYYSGLRFGDAVRFDYNTYVIEDTRGRRLLLSTQKTGEIVSMPFTEEITEIVEYIKDKRLGLTNSELNAHLKVIGQKAGINKPIKTHMGRHSFAMHCAEIGMSEEAVQHLLGHKDRQSTRIYFRIKNNRVDNEMQAWKKKPPQQ